MSYAWGDKTLDASQEARQRQEVVERLRETLDKERYNDRRNPRYFVRLGTCFLTHVLLRSCPENLTLSMFRVVCGGFC